MEWTRLTHRLPDLDTHDRVLIYTEGIDFAGEQFFDVKAESLNENAYEDPADQPEVCRHATHWAPRPAVTPNGAAIATGVDRLSPPASGDELLATHFTLHQNAATLRRAWQVTCRAGMEEAAKELAHAILGLETAAAQISDALASAAALSPPASFQGNRPSCAAARAHYPEEWGPSDARRLTCVCGHPDPFHADGADNGKVP